MTYDQLLCWVKQALLAARQDKQIEILSEIKQVLDEIAQGRIPENPTNIISKKLFELVNLNAPYLIVAKFTDRSDGREYAPGELYDMLTRRNDVQQAFMISIKRFQSEDDRIVFDVMREVDLEEAVPQAVPWKNERSNDYNIDYDSVDAKKALQLVDSVFSRVVNFQFQDGDANGAAEEDALLQQVEFSDAYKAELLALGKDVLDSISVLRKLVPGVAGADDFLPAMIYGLKLTPGVFEYHHSNELAERLFQIGKQLNTLQSDLSDEERSGLDYAEADYYLNQFAIGIAGLAHALPSNVQILKYRVYAEDMPGSDGSERRYYQDFAEDGFLITAKKDGFDQFLADFYDRSWEINGYKRLGIQLGDKDDRDDIVAKVAEKFAIDKDHISSLMRAHTQDLTVIPNKLLSEPFQDLYNLQSVTVSPSDKYRYYVYSGEHEDSGSLYLKVVYDGFPIRPDGDQESQAIGRLPGPLEVVYQIKEDEQKRLGCQLLYFDTENPDIMQAMTGGYLHREDLLFKYCDLDKVSYATAKQVLTDRLEQQDETNELVQRAQNVLDQMEMVGQNGSKVKEADLSRTLLQTSWLLLHPAAIDKLDPDCMDVTRGMTGEPLSREELFEKYCDLSEVSYDVAKQVLTDRISQLGRDHELAARAQIVLDEVEKVKRDNPKVKTGELSRTLLETSGLIMSPTVEKAERYQRSAKKVSKRPWGQILSSAMLILGGLALVAASVTAMVFTFGASAPASAVGLVFGVGMLAAAGGAAISVSGAKLFANKARKPDLRKSMEELASKSNKPHQR